jgi:hypothetical protein
VTDTPASPATPATPGSPPPSGADDTADGDGPVLPEVSRDDLDEGWGDDPRDGRRDAQWYERERPPHHE